MSDDVADGTKPVLIKRSENSAIRIVRTVFNGKEYVDVRNMMRKGTDADWIPTRKGVMIPLDNAVDVATAMRAVSRVKQAVVVLTKEQYTKAVRSSKLVLPEHVLRTDVPKSVPTGHRCFPVTIWCHFDSPVNDARVYTRLILVIQIFTIPLRKP